MTQVGLLVPKLQEYQICLSLQPNERLIHDGHTEDHLARKRRTVWLDTLQRQGDQQRFGNELLQPGNFLIAWLEGRPTDQVVLWQL